MRVNIMMCISMDQFSIESADWNPCLLWLVLVSHFTLNLHSSAGGSLDFRLVHCNEHYPTGIILLLLNLNGPGGGGGNPPPRRFARYFRGFFFTPRAFVTSLFQVLRNFWLCFRKNRAYGSEVTQYYVIERRLKIWHFFFWFVYKT